MTKAEFTKRLERMIEQRAGQTMDRLEWQAFVQELLRWLPNEWTLEG
jgi:hypothetical protein